MNSSLTISKITLIPLGVCSADQNRYQKCSSYLLNIETHTETTSQTYQFLFDTGNKRSASKQWIHLNQLKIIFISHYHIDHTLYLRKLLQNLSKTPRSEPITLIMHEHTWKIQRMRLKLFHKMKLLKNVRIQEIQLPIRKSLHESLNAIIDLPKISVDESHQEFSIQVSVMNACHNIDCVVYRVSFFNVDSNEPLISFIYSPDTHYTSEYLTTAFAKDCDYWLLDTTFNNDYLEKYKFDDRKPHSCPRYSATLCEKAKVKTYLAGHYYWKRFAKRYEDIEQNIKIQTENRFSGNIIVLQDKKEVILYSKDLKI